MNAALVWEAIRTFDLEEPATPGHGRTADRWMSLFEVARRRTLSVARLVEAHVDALTILMAASRPPGSGLYGVWASRGTLTFDGSVVSGVKPFCSGAGVVDRALVTAMDVGGEQVLLEVSTRATSGLAFDWSSWSAVGMRDAQTATAAFDSHPVIGPPIGPKSGWYLGRDGFWHGAIGPAACWAGGAAAVVDRAEDLVDGEPHRRAHLGAMRAGVISMTALLIDAGRWADADHRPREAVQARALATRHVIERTSSEIIDRFSRAFGPRPFLEDPSIEGRIADLDMFRRQSHAERDLDALGRIPRDCLT